MVNFSHNGFGNQGQMLALMRERDWGNSPLGAPETWPPALATAASMMLHSAFPMFVAWGGELRLLYNDAYARLLGDKHPAALGQPMQRVWGALWPDIVPLIDRAMSGKPVHYSDMPATVLRDGYPEQVYLTFSYAPLHDASGVAGVYCTCIDTTDRVMDEARAAFELRVSDALRPLDSAEDVIATASELLGGQLDVSRVLYAEMDHERGTFVVPRYWAHSGAADLSRDWFRLDDFGREIGDALRAGTVVRVEDARCDPRTSAFANAYAADGIRALMVVPLVKSGRLIACLGVDSSTPRRWSGQDVHLAREVAERTWAAARMARAQADLREERDRSRYIFDTIAEGFALFDRDWTVLQLNAEGERITRMRAEDVIGRNHWDLFPAAAETAAGRMYFEVMRTRQPGCAEYCASFPDGEQVWTETRAYPTQDGGIASFFRDITDRRRAEERLKEADRRKDEFLAMLAHELRNPLAPISAAAELLRIGTLDESRVRQSSAIIGRQVRHMTRLVDDLLDVSRVTRGLITLTRATVAARTIVDEAVEQVGPAVQARRQQLVVRFQAGSAMVEGDKARLVQVLANVLGNATKYTPEGRRIELCAETRDGKLVLRVSDEGIGMEQELTARVFDLFAQAARSSDRSLGGLGLGLALVKHLVELHGGAVSCSSPGLGRGSVFEIGLPLLAAGAPAPQEAHAAPRGSGRLKVMVVDDNVDAAETLGMLLEASGFEVCVEHDGPHALARARLALPDACLLDIGLPGMDGNELARRLRADAATAHMVLVAVTGYGQAGDRDAALASGFAHHMVKPVDIDRLVALLEGIRAGGAAPA